MLTTLLLLLCLNVVSYAVENRQESSFFVRCDTDHNKVLSRKELVKCLSKMEDIQKLNQIIENGDSHLIDMLDTNGDDEVSLAEYMTFLETRQAKKKKDGDDADMVTVKTKDGRTKQMSREQMRAQMSETMKGMSMKNDKLYKEDVTVGTVEDISKKNPEMGRFMQLGHWVHGILKKLNHTSNSTTILQLKTLPTGGIEAVNSGVADEEEDRNTQIAMMSFASNFTVWLALHLDNKPIGTREVFEVVVAYDPHLYRRPYLTILEGWRLTPQQPLQKKSEENAAEGSKPSFTRAGALSFPPPRFQDESPLAVVSVILKSQVDQHGFVPVAGVVVLTLLACVGSLFYFCCIHDFVVDEPHEKAE